HALTAPNQQGIVEMLPEPLQGMTDRGLRQRETSRSAAHLAFLEQHVQCQQKVQIQPSQMNSTHRDYDRYALGYWRGPFYHPGRYPGGGQGHDDERRAGTDRGRRRGG